MKIAELRGPLLRSVSRSFYLSIRLLPGKLRDPIGLAYLLARATDTIADTTEIDAELRAEELAKLAAWIQGDVPASGTAAALESFARLQNDAAERALMEAVPAALDWLQSMPADDQADIRSVLLKINEGQTLDLQRFPDSRQMRALVTAGELDHYTYLVAGSVGEFWTKICSRHLRSFATRPPNEMISLGIDYGKGLQLVNILRDAGSDLRSGRSYLPAEALNSLGVAETELRDAPERAAPILPRWLQRAEEGLQSGIEYACAIRSTRVRFATALPALIGARTLALLRKVPAEIFVKKIKISRSEVRQIIFQAGRTLASPRALREAYRQLSL